MGVKCYHIVCSLPDILKQIIQALLGTQVAVPGMNVQREESITDQSYFPLLPILGQKGG